MEVSHWRAVIDGELRNAASEILEDLAVRLSDPDRVHHIATVANSQGQPRSVRHWSPTDCSYGDASLALLFGQMDRCFPDRGWDLLAHQYIELAARDLEQQAIHWLSPGMFGGFAGLCFTVDQLSLGGQRYSRLRDTLDGLLVQFMSNAPDNRETLSQGMRFGDYDVIGGRSGVGRYLLSRQDNPALIPPFQRLLTQLLTLSQIRGEPSPFFVPPEYMPTDRHRLRYPQGATDCGLAHGMPGPLGLFALAQLHGVDLPALPSSIERLSTWLVDQRCDDEWGVNWPFAVSADTTTVAPPPARAAWCYGSPGVASALWWAGAALGDPTLQLLSVEAIRAIARRPSHVRAIPSPIICHGVAGLLEVVLRFSNRDPDPVLVSFAQELTHELISLYEPASLVGFRDIDPIGARIDNPGFLEGAAGVALVLLAATTDVEPTWDRMLLLS